MKYYVVESGSLNNLSSRVRNRLKNGWELQGGIGCYALDSPCGFFPIFCQAMIKKEGNEK